MTNEMNSPDPLEELWQESEAAREAGVFRRTPAPVERLLDRSRGSTAVSAARLRARWVGIAAALAIVAGTWTMLFRTELASLRERAGLATAPSISPQAELAVDFGNCLQGPGADALLAGCADQDLNADGNVDLRDFSLRLTLADRSP